MAGYIIKKHSLVCMILIAVILPCQCLAVTMDINCGFNRQAKQNKWMPIAVSLTNTSSDSIDGILQVADLDSKKPNPPQCISPVNLPPNSKKLYHIYISADYVNSDCEVRLLNGRYIEARKKIYLELFDNNSFLIGTVSKKSAGGQSTDLRFLNGETIKVWKKQNNPNKYSGSASTGGQIENRIAAGYINPDLLPDRPGGYESLDMLVLSDFSADSVNSKVLEAISMWTASGGTLVVSGGANYKNLTHSFYKELLPVDTAGLIGLNGLGSVAKLATAPPMTGEISAIKSTVKPQIGFILASQQGIPIIAERNYGAGKVIFLAFDHSEAPFNAWQGQTDFWKYISKISDNEPLISSSDNYPKQRYGRASYYMNYNDGNVLSSLISQSPNISMPSFGVIGLYLLAYLICLVPVNYAIMKKKGRMELAWISTPIIVLIFALGSYAIGYTMKGGSLKLEEVSIIEASSGVRYASKLTDASIFSPARRSYDATFDDSMSMGRTSTNTDSSDINDFILTDKTLVPDINMAMWSLKTMEFKSGVDLNGALNANLTLNGNILKGTITNNTNVNYKNCYIVWGGKKIKISDQPKGSAMNIDFDYNKAQFNDRFDANIYSIKSQRQSKTLNNLLLGYVFSSTNSRSFPYLVAESGESNEYLSITNNKYSSTNAKVYAFKLDYKLPSKFTFNSQSISGNIMSDDTGSINNNGNVMITQWDQGKALVSFNFNNSINRKITDVNISLTGQSQGGAGMGGGMAGGPRMVNKAIPFSIKNMSYSIYNATRNNWNSFLPLNNSISISNPANYINESGKMLVKIENPKRFGSLTLDIVAHGVAQ